MLSSHILETTPQFVKGAVSCVDLFWGFQASRLCWSLGPWLWGSAFGFRFLQDVVPSQ